MNYLSPLVGLLKVAGLPAVSQAVECLQLGWVAIAAAVIGAASAYDSSKRNERAAERASGSQPYSQDSRTGPPEWVDPYVRDAAHTARDIFNSRIEDPWIPPTFNQATSGNLRGRAPGFPSFVSTERSDAGGGPPGGGPGGSDREEDALEDFQKNRPPPGAETDLPFNRPPPGYGSSDVFDLRGDRNPRPRPGRGPSPASGGPGTASRRPATPNYQDLLAQYVMDRSTADRDPAAQGSLDFLSEIQSGSGPAFSQQQQTYDDIRSPDSPLNQLLSRGLSGGMNRATPYQTSFLDALMGRFGQQQQPTQRTDLLALMQGDPFYDIGDAGRRRSGGGG